MHPIFKLLKPPINIFVTLFLWLYFIAGFVIVFMPVLIFLTPIINNREERFQKANYYFYKIFFSILRVLSPGLSMKIGDDIKKIKSSVVIANHRSYFDPILLISIFPKHKTIVKGIFFKIPILSWVMRSEGFISYSPENSYNDSIMKSLKNIPDFTKSGGNLFIFPEGRRSRDGRLGKLHKGAFSIAKKYNLPLIIIYISNTGPLFSPGKFFLNTCINNKISIEKLGTIEPSKYTVQEMREKAVKLFENRLRARPKT